VFIPTLFDYQTRVKIPIFYEDKSATVHTKRDDKFFIEIIVYHEQCLLCGFRLNFAVAILVVLMFILFS